MYLVTIECPWCITSANYCYDKGSVEVRCLHCGEKFYIRKDIELGRHQIMSVWLPQPRDFSGVLRWRYAGLNFTENWIEPPEEPPEPKKEKPKNEPKPAPPPPPPPVFEMSAAAGPYRPKPVSPHEPPKESWLRRHKNEIIHALTAVATVTAYVVSQIL